MKLLKKINEKNSKGKIMFFEKSPIESEIKLAKKKSYKIRQAAKLLTLSTKYFDENGTWTAKNFLEYHGFNPPIKKRRSTKEIFDLLNKIIYK